MHLDFTEELNEAKELWKDQPAGRVERIQLTRTIVPTLGLKRLMIVYVKRHGYHREFESAEDIAAFDRVFTHFVNAAGAATMSLIGCVDGLKASTVTLSPHRANLTLSDPSEEPTAHKRKTEVIETVSRRWLGLRSPRFTLTARGRFQYSTTRYGRRPPTETLMPA